MYVGIYTWGWRNKKPLLKTAHLTTYDIISMTAMLKFALQLADFLNAHNSLVPILLVLCSGKPDCWNLGILFGILNLATWFKELTHWEKTLMLAKTEGRKRRGWQEYEMVGQHHQFNGHEFEQTLGDSEEQRSLACYSPWGHSQTWLSNWKTTTTNSLFTIDCSLLRLFFFDVDYFLKSLLNLLQFCFCYVLGFWPWGMWDLSFSTRDQTHTLSMGRQKS